LFCHFLSGRLARDTGQYSSKRTFSDEARQFRLEVIAPDERRKVFFQTQISLTLEPSDGMVKNEIQYFWRNQLTH
jgi:hypothetical protein